ncbi:hypothetical protein [Undibacterium sp. Di24W]|uniref:hypothetical protein n=1 Tax=Undibacterium sp. Di24W TaxID=3413033 RepID=UPI003BEFA0AA
MLLYSEAQWEPEPSADASELEFDTWEARNPMWQLKRELDVYLDADFVETIHGAHLFSYLSELLVDATEVDAIWTSATLEANTVLLIFDQALGGFPVRLSSTSRLDYVGEFRCRPLRGL